MSVYKISVGRLASNRQGQSKGSANKEHAPPRPGQDHVEQGQPHARSFIGETAQLVIDGSQTSSQPFRLRCLDGDMVAIDKRCAE